MSDSQLISSGYMILKMSVAAGCMTISSITLYVSGIVIGIQRSNFLLTIFCEGKLIRLVSSNLFYVLNPCTFGMVKIFTNETDATFMVSLGRLFALLTLYTTRFTAFP